MAHPSSLGPRTFGLPHVRHTHHSWLSQFRPQERRSLVTEDCYARNHVAGLLVGVMGIGLTLMGATIWWCL
jgi:hypothetical protein